MTLVAISLGSNQGDSRALLKSAMSSLVRTLESHRIASLYRTAPISEILQPDFLNTAVSGRTELTPEDLLAVLKACEHVHGRRRSRRWGPRPLDLDLLLFGDLVSHRPELSVPHPRLRRRRFFLEPLAEIAPHLPVPPDGSTVVQLLSQLPPDPGIVRVPWELD